MIYDDNRYNTHTYIYTSSTFCVYHKLYQKETSFWHFPLSNFPNLMILRIPTRLEGGEGPNDANQLLPLTHPKMIALKLSRTDRKSVCLPFSVSCFFLSGVDDDLR